MAVSEDQFKLTAPRTSSLLQVQDDVSADRHTLVLSGELDIASAQTLEASILEIFSAEATGLVIDLSELAFMDSTGLRAIINAQKLCEKHGCDFGLIPGPESVQRVFEITGLDKTLAWTTPRRAPGRPA